MYHIGTNGKIRLAPGTYEISRVPVSRYEFVTSGVSAAYIDPVPTTITEKFDGSSNHVETFDVTVESGKTVDVHYYDQVAYYDKFTHVDTTVNKFYTLDNSKQNTTVKGIRVEYLTNIPTSSSTAQIAYGNANVSGMLNAWFIFVDGSEREMTAAEKEALTFSYDPAQNNNESLNLTTDSNNHNISITDITSDYASKVYTVQATHGNFTTKFDIVFAQ